jgi:putative tricarboxylic transport membrane protein
MVENIMSGLSLMMTFENLLLTLMGVILGTLLGAIPGLTSTMGIALLLPITFSLSPVAAIVMLTAMYKGGLFGGSISAILFNAPGTSAAAATAIDGYEMAKQGKAGKAMKIALIASSVGDLFGCLTLILLAGLIAKFALMFGPPEYAAVILFAFTMVLGVAEKSLMKGFLAMSAGIMLSTFGYDPVTGVPRFEFGSMQMASGFNLVPVLIGLLAVSEVFVQMEKILRGDGDNKSKELEANSSSLGDSSLSWKEVRGTGKIIVRAASIGTFIGSLPGLGPTIAAFMGYKDGKKVTKNPEKYGKGSIDGVAAPEAANSAVGSANLIPLLSLGIPGDIEAALILGALIIQGIVPGPQIFVNNGPIIYGIYAGMLMAIMMNFIFNWFFIKGAIKLRNISIKTMIPVILILCTAGAYGMDQNLFDVKVMLLFGIIGYLMYKFKIPATALLIGFILGPIFESSIRQSLIISNNSILIFFKTPISLLFIALTVITIIRYIYKNNKLKEGDKNIA